MSEGGKYIQFYYMQCNQDYENKIEPDITKRIICDDEEHLRLELEA